MPCRPTGYWTLSAGDEPGPGAEGGLTVRAEAPEGVVIHVGVDDIEDAPARVVRADGRHRAGGAALSPWGGCAG